MITGKTTTNSVIHFSGDLAIPSGTIVSPDIFESGKYHTTADGMDIIVMNHLKIDDLLLVTP
ncbi:hypothetical protein [Enterococcus mundtii]|uniref:hypothetical protein n=1 Tax=Enterococcus mundtii TaxID=53346 RepID=UPI0013776055|nr:hypothetical protein [Enterococcus mundtii]